MIDYTKQINLSRKLSKVRQDLFKFLSGLAQETFDEAAMRWGILLIVGNFAPVSYKLDRYIGLGDSDISEHVVMYGTRAFKDAIKNFRNSDGAFVLDSASGQLLGNRVLYLDLKDDVSEEKGARHHAAASVSKDEGIDFAITVSEETLTTRLYESGVVSESEDVKFPVEEGETVEEDVSV